MHCQDILAGDSKRLTVPEIEYMLHAELGSLYSFSSSPLKLPNTGKDPPQRPYWTSIL